MENAEVLEMTVKHVESILQNRAKGELGWACRSCHCIFLNQSLKYRNGNFGIKSLIATYLSLIQQLTA